MNSAQSLRALSVAFGVGAVMALLVDAVLSNALATAQSPGGSSLTPWWVTGHFWERASWVFVAVLGWALSLFLSSQPAGNDVLGRAEAFEIVGRAMIIIPLLWRVAVYLTFAARVTLEGTWSSEGQVFFFANFYTNALLSYLPWVAGGATLLALRRHVGDA